MSYVTELLRVLTSRYAIKTEVHELIERLWNEHREALEQIMLKFLTNEISPGAMFDFETAVAEQFREFARQVMEQMLNQIEADEPEKLPHDVEYRAGGYRRLNKKTRNSYVATLFGTVALWRYSYRYWHRDSREACIFPLEIELGLVHGATPALAEAVSRDMATAGATQQAVLDRLRLQHGVRWGPQRLRDITQEISAAFAEMTQEAQVERLLEMLKTADQSRGSRRPVLSVGRDGVTLREYRFRFFEHAAVGTVTVYDRAGKRLGTVYLAFAPEPGQQQLTERLTALLREALRRWDGPLPRLTYVTDAGENETQYYQKVLSNMAHPCTGKKLCWIRIVDYYHASQRIWTMAEALFGKDHPTGRAWARRMCRILKRPNGPFRALHSAAALRTRRKKLSKSRVAEFGKAYRYIRRRSRHMQYHEYKRMNLPIGSGVTEAACKTVVTQRLKLSGMRWIKDNSQTILNLRVALLSGIWQPLYRRLLQSHDAQALRTYTPFPKTAMREAA